MESIGKTKLKKTVFWCEELLVGNIQGLAKGIDTSELDTSVKFPDGRTMSCVTVEVEDGYSIKFTPAMMGIHTAGVKKNGEHVEGSPFKFAIEPFDDGHMRCRATGPGLKHGEIDQPREVRVTTVEAGAGGLSVSTEGPMQSFIEFYTHEDGACGIVYRCAKPGQYKLAIKFNGRHIPDSPFNVKMV